LQNHYNKSSILKDTKRKEPGKIPPKDRSTGMASEKQNLVFISYSRINKDFALELANELRASGFNIWFDLLDIPTGSRWDDEIESALERCEIFMVILTPSSTISDNVKDEIGYAIDSGKRILPILLKDANVPLRLRRFQYVDFTDISYNEGIERAKELLRKLIDESARAIPKSDDINAQGSQPDRSAELQADAQRLARQRADAVRKAREKEQLERNSQVTSSAPVIQKRAPQPQSQPQKQQSTKLFSIIGIVALLSILCIGGGYFVVTNLPLSKTPITPTNTPSPTPTMTATIESPPGVTPPTPIPPGPDPELAFVSDRDQTVGSSLQAFVIDPDNPNPLNYRPFASNPSGYEYVYWPSFCGDQLAVEVQNKSGNPQWIYFLDRTSPPSRWGLASGDELGQPRCSPDGRYISYSAFNEKKWDTLVVADVANGSIILSSSQDNIVGRASWPLSAESMLFPVYINSDNWSFYFMKNFGVASYESQILNLKGVSPSISPDGQQIAYYCPDKGDGSLCVANINDKLPRFLYQTDISHNSDFHNNTGVWVSSVTPVWSSDGQWIYYIDNDGGDYDIFRIHPDGSGRENITRDWPSNEFMPATR
jgi:hypothetical protein